MYTPAVISCYISLRFMHDVNKGGATSPVHVGHGWVTPAGRGLARCKHTSPNVRDKTRPNHRNLSLILLKMTVYTINGHCPEESTDEVATDRPAPSNGIYKSLIIIS